MNQSKQKLSSRKQLWADVNYLAFLPFDLDSRPFDPKINKDLHRVMRMMHMRCLNAMERANKSYHLETN